MAIRSLFLSTSLLLGLSSLMAIPQNDAPFWDETSQSPKTRSLSNFSFSKLFESNVTPNTLPQKIADLGTEVEKLRLVHNKLLTYANIFPVLLHKRHIKNLEIAIDPEEEKDMDEASFSSLLKYLKETEHLESFKFYQSYISEEMATRFADALTQNKSLQGFSMTAYILGAEAIRPFTGTPGKNHKNGGQLKTLDLNGYFGLIKHEEWCGDLLDSLADAREGFQLLLPRNEDGRSLNYQVQEGGKVLKVYPRTF